MDGHFAAAVVLSALVGLSLGLLGGGGSILAVPILVYVALVPPAEAIGASLLLVGTTAVLAGLVHLRAGRVRLRAAAAFALAGAAGAPAGAQLTPLVPGPVLILLFGALMVLVGTLMVARRAAAPGPALREPRGPATVALAGFGVGVLTGFLGVGGGFLIVPALVLLVRLPMPEAVGTSLFVIALNSLTGFAAHLGRGALPLAATAAFTSTAVVGALAGSRLAGRLDADRLRRAFGVFVLVVGLLLVARNLGPLAGWARPA